MVWAFDGSKARSRRRCFSSLYKNFGEGMAAVGGTKDAALFIGAVGMAFGGDEEAVWILRIDENRRDLLGVAKVLHVRPGFTRVGGFIDSVAGGEIRALQSFAAADINNVRIGRGDGESADGAGGLIVENGIPGVAKSVVFPDAAVDGGHVKHIGLVRDAGDATVAASAEGPDAAPSAFRRKVFDRSAGRLLIAQKIVATAIPAMNHFPAA